MPDSTTKAKLSVAGKRGGAGSHKPDCQCAFCKNKRIKEARESGESPFKPQIPETAPAPPTPQKVAKGKAESSAEMLQAVHDIGNAIMPDPRWHLPDSEAIEWGETTVALREKHETIDRVLDGGMYFRPLAKLFKIERNRAFKIVPEKGGISAIVRLPYARTRARREQAEESEDGNGWPDQVSNEDWNNMSDLDKQAHIHQFRERFVGVQHTGMDPGAAGR